MMQIKQGDTLDALRAVQQFLVDHDTRLGPVATCGARLRLDGVIAELAMHAAEQTVGTIERQMATQAHHVRRAELVRLHMAAIVAVARLGGPNEQALAAFRMPAGNLSGAKLEAAAMGMASVAADHAAVFISAGLPPTFVEDLREVAQAMGEARGAQGLRRAAVGAATTGIRTTLTTGRRLVALLDRLIRREAREDVPLLMSWESVKQTHHIGRRAAQLVLGPGAPVPTLPRAEARVLLSAGDDLVANQDQDGEISG